MKGGRETRISRSLQFAPCHDTGGATTKGFTTLDILGIVDTPGMIVLRNTRNFPSLSLTYLAQTQDKDIWYHHGRGGYENSMALTRQSGG